MRQPRSFTIEPPIPESSATSQMHIRRSPSACWRSSIRFNPRVVAGHNLLHRLKKTTFAAPSAVQQNVENSPSNSSIPRSLQATSFSSQNGELRLSFAPKPLPKPVTMEQELPAFGFFL